VAPSLRYPFPSRDRAYLRQSRHGLACVQTLRKEEAIEVRHCRNQAEAITQTQKATHQIFNVTRPMGHRLLRLEELLARSGPGYKLHECASCTYWVVLSSPICREHQTQKGLPCLALLWTLAGYCLFADGDPSFISVSPCRSLELQPLWSRRPVFGVEFACIFLGMNLFCLSRFNVNLILAAWFESL
jgi:hypothetical protein